MESHVALEIVEKVVRLTLADKVKENSLAYGKPTFDSDKKEEPPERPEPMWNGPQPRAAMKSVFISGGQHRSAPQIGSK